MPSLALLCYLPLPLVQPLTNLLGLNFETHDTFNTLCPTAIRESTAAPVTPAERLSCRVKCLTARQLSTVAAVEATCAQAAELRATETAAVDLRERLFEEFPHESKIRAMSPRAIFRSTNFHTPVCSRMITLRLAQLRSHSPCLYPRASPSARRRSTLLPSCPTCFLSN